MKSTTIRVQATSFVVLAVAACLGLGVSLSARLQDASAQDDETARAELFAAAHKLAEAPGYRWTSAMANADTGPAGAFGAQANAITRGETERGGFTHVVMPPEAGQVEFVSKAGKAAISLEGNWQKVDPALTPGSPPSASSSRDPRMMMVAGFRMPADQAQDLLNQTSDYKRKGDVITAALRPEVTTMLLSEGAPRRGRRAGQGGPAVDDPQGTVRFRVENGVLTEYTLEATGSRKIFDNEVKLDRKLTTKINVLGAAKVEVPQDAREIVLALAAGEEPKVFVPEPGFHKLFDGRTLDGWKGREGFWTVEESAIVGRTTKENPLKGNTFLFAQKDGKDLIVDDFELRVSYRITPNNDAGFANSGIQYRSKNKGNFVAAGYQADFEAGKTYSGILYDEAGGAGGRGIMAQRGEKVTWTAEGKKEVTGKVGDSAEIQAKIKPDDWNEYVVIARGNHLQHFINGMPTVDVFDDLAAKRLESGILALQLHAGQPMTVRFKDIRIKPLKTAAESAAADIHVAKGFKAEQIYSVPRQTQGSWVALCTDPKGRLIAADQSGKLYRMTLPPVGRSGSIDPEPIGVDLAGAHGLLYAFDSLYAMVNERGTHGFYRVRDTDGDDKYDEVKLLREIKGGGEHGMHSIALSPDGKSLYVVCGNSTQLTKVDKSRVPLNWCEDNLPARIPTGFMDDSMAPQGYICRTDPDGKEWELIASGMRNPFDIAFNHDGELFTYDADMEWDIGEPWYRPTRVNHIISGAEFGFRNGSGKWPAYSVDSFGAVVDIGPGSPTGITFGYGSKFPEKYRDALYISDWSFGKLRAVHLKPQGASYTAEVEEFLSGQPLPVTDVVINPHDGAMYLAVGGRGAQSALYRVSYVGGEGNGEASAAQTDSQAAAKRALRQKLEAFHGHADPAAVEAVWPYLSDPDRALRYVARVALEWQEPAQWRDRALGEKDARKAIAALVALARVSGRDEIHTKPGDPAPDPALRAKMLEALDAIEWSRISPQDHADLLRAYELVFTRLRRPDEATCQKLAAKLEALFPTHAVESDYALAELLCYLQAPGAAAKIVKAMHESPTQEEQIHYALQLRVLKTGWTIPLRKDYFNWFLNEGATFRGGNTFASSMRTMRTQALQTLTADEREALKDVLAARPTRKSPRDLLAARKPVKEWTLTEVVPLVETGLREKRDLERGRRLFGEVACSACHRFRNEGGGVGPDLTALAGRFSVHDVLEAVVEPSKVISDQYAAISIALKDGRIVTGRVGNLHGDNLQVVEDMFDPGHMTSVNRKDVEAIKPSPVSVMPAGLLNSLTKDEIQDLLAFLLTQPEGGVKATASAGGGSGGK